MRDPEIMFNPLVFYSGHIIGHQRIHDLFYQANEHQEAPISKQGPR